MRSNFRKLRVEKLEDRHLLAGGMPTAMPIPPPSLTISYQPPVSVSPILQGSRDQGIQRLSITVTGGTYARLAEMMFIPAVGSGPLALDAYCFYLKGDLNSNAKDGCETILCSAGADYQTGIVDFNMYQPIWVRPGQPLNLEVSIDASTYFMGAGIGVELAFAGFYDLRSQVVPYTSITYVGSPTLQPLSDAMLNVSQQYMSPQAASVFPGDSADLLKFYVWSNNAAPTTGTFVALQGALSNATGYTMDQDINNDGVVDSSVSGTINLLPDGTSDLVFNFGALGVQGGMFDIHARISSSVPSSNPFLQLGFPSNGVGWAGTNATTGAPLSGEIFNGNGAGQLIIYTMPNCAPTYTIMADGQPAVYATEIPSTMPNVATANSGDNIVVDAFAVKPSAGQTNLAVGAVAIIAAEGDVQNCVSYTLWAYVGTVKTQIATGFVFGGQVWFNGFNQPVANTPQGTMFEVHAVVPQQPVGGVFQASLASIHDIQIENSGVFLPADAVFTEYGSQTIWEFPGFGGGLG